MGKPHQILLKLWILGFIASLTFFGLGEIIPGGGWPGGIFYYLMLLIFFPMNVVGMLILMKFWKPDYMTADGLPMMFLIISICINWIAILIPVYLMTLFLKGRKRGKTDVQTENCNKQN